ncbi:hypothetical protein [Corynebacterium diphtheriae]|uniref:hypothetical protein n=1 Tax=Corynebacterium diphtheriae TaxID=1717 RepID=UPI0008FB8593|nr:hypothetical protein [Corynebacterium diphtheriae]MDZ5308289.1 HK97 gp10 family phage protein [Corynebacterium diphtheriae]OIR92167.1 hypothetical protein BHF89_10030 [Corynebacterium diphtheriae]OIR96051.1 hypothetical protein BHF93_02175 [Corynebacterium diphtheriae]OIR98044.1 hypothetical protein BHF90_09765 [Corynebacterium diphtheriae]TBX16025.1 hypothetical protein BUW94_09050 [Corynebacterium diphtheriae]
MTKGNSFFSAQAHVEGAARLRRTLKKAGGDLDDLKEANRRAAKAIKPIAEGMAPVLTGRLQASIRVGATRKAGILRAGRKTVAYAGPVHWGWPAHGIKANPFMSNAAIRNQHVWEKEYIAALEAAIRKVKGK